jgi:hypothetical protein
MIYKQWRFECTECHQITKHICWDADLATFDPTCPCGGHLFPEHALKPNAGVVGDDIPGGLVMEHVEPGRKVYSRTELKARLARKGYQLSDGWREGDKYLKRWI